MSGIFEAFGVGRDFVVFAAAFLVWVAVVACAAWSVFAQPFTRQQKIMWLIIIAGIPLFGLMAYLPFSIRRDDNPLLFQAKK